MRFEHHEEIWRDFPGLVPGVIHAEGITPAADETHSQRFDQARLSDAPDPLKLAA